MVASTSGTLSTAADAIPKTVAVISAPDPTCSVSHLARDCNTPALSSAATDMMMPVKNSRLGMSTLLKDSVTRSACTILPPGTPPGGSIQSHKIQTTDRASIIPMYGGTPAMTRKNGTNKMDENPTQNTTMPAAGLRSSMGITSCSLSSGSTENFENKRNSSKGTPVHTTEGKIKSLTVAAPVILSSIHSMVVVTSPTGLHAPPALAANTTNPPIVDLSFVSDSEGSILRVMDTTTIVAVKLSTTADNKNVNTHKTGKILGRLPCTTIPRTLVTTLNPPLPSMVSTTAMAGSRNKIIAPVSSMPWRNSASRSSSPSAVERTVQRQTQARRTEAVLWTPISSSKATSTSPTAKTIPIVVPRLSISSSGCWWPIIAPSSTAN
mmetsp:Transcript_18305/g.40542  ORF Transcript_18305/g.40542 Transcript_18305/m.40542 type:complete len:380 (-) Transcript_18305:297-1436(-)